MRIMNLYKHKNNTDVAIMPIKVPFFVKEKNGYKIRVKWFNIVNPKKIFDLFITETIFVKKSDISNWKYYEPTVKI